MEEDRTEFGNDKGYDMLLFQYAYYMMRKADERMGLSPRITKFKAPVLFFIVETWIAAACYLLIHRLILGEPFQRFPSSTPLLFIAYLFAFVLCYINIKIIGHESRIQQYKLIFEAWSSEQHMRWKVLVILIAVASLGAFFCVGEISQNGLSPQNWKY